MGYDFLRNAFLGSEPLPTPNKRIYIRRKGARRILNEQDVIGMLVELGFLVVDLETMTVAEQVALFSTSEVITAPHGEGLTNLTFCQPGTKVLEIFSPAYIICLYSMISSFGNLKHYYFIGDYGKRGPGMKEDWSGFDNMKIKMQFS